MAQITINIDDAKVARVVAALAEAFGWDGRGNRAAFVRDAVASHLASMVRQVERTKAERTAMASVADPPDPGIS